MWGWSIPVHAFLLMFRTGVHVTRRGESEVEMFPECLDTRMDHGALRCLGSSYGLAALLS